MPKAKKAVDVAAEATKKAAEIQAEKNEADAEFRDAVAKAAEKRNTRLAKLPITPGTNIAEVAWNDTKAEDDPVYSACAFEHRAKLDTAVDHIRRTGSADIAGLEAFEERVKELLVELDQPTGGALVPAETAGK